MSHQRTNLRLFIQSTHNRVHTEVQSLGKISYGKATITRKRFLLKICIFAGVPYFPNTLEGFPRFNFSCSQSNFNCKIQDFKIK